MKTLIKNRVSAIIMVVMISVSSPCRGEANEKKLVLSTMNWQPYYAAHLPEGGPLAEITKEAFKQVGYDIEIRFVPWKRALEMSKRGKYDGLVGAFYNEERSRFFTYTEKLADSELVLVSRKGSGISYASLEDLKPYRIGIIRGASITQDFDNATYLNIEEVNKQEQNVKKLVAGRIDLIAAGKFPVLQILNKKLPDLADSVEIIKPPLQANGLFNALSKQNPAHESIVSDFNRGLKKMREVGIFGRIMKKHGITENR